MIRIAWKPVLQVLALRDYCPDYGDQTIMVCVNSPPDLVQQIMSISDELWFSQLWSFGDEQFTPEDLNEYDRIDSHFFPWLMMRSIQMLDAHKDAHEESLKNALAQYVETGTSSHPMLKALFQSFYLNGKNGYAVVAPWDLLEGYSPEEWVRVSVMLGKAHELLKEKRTQKQVFNKKVTCWQALCRAL